MLQRCTVARQLVPHKVFDTHCHLGVKGDNPLPAFQRAVQQNVRGLVVVGIDAASAEKSRDVAESLSAAPLPHDGEPCAVNWSAGLHPHHAGRYREEWSRLASLVADGRSGSSNARCVAVGETGLDYFKSQASRTDQRSSLERHLALSSSLGLPIILHCRDAYADMFEVLETFASSLPSKRLDGVFHCFSDGVESMHRAVSLGLHVSFCCTLGYRGRRSDALRDACALCPLESIVIETDSPWLPPVTMRGATNEPAFVHHALDAVIACKTREGANGTFAGRDALATEVQQAIAQQLFANSQRLFGLASNSS